VDQKETGCNSDTGGRHVKERDVFGKIQSDPMVLIPLCPSSRECLSQLSSLKTCPRLSASQTDVDHQSYLPELLSSPGNSFLCVADLELHQSHLPLLDRNTRPITMFNLDSRIASLADPDPRPVQILLEPLVVFRQTAELELGHGLFVRSGRHCCCEDDVLVRGSRDEVVADLR
jgi:hypothetical protein